MVYVKLVDKHVKTTFICRSTTTQALSESESKH